MQRVSAPWPLLGALCVGANTPRASCSANEQVIYLFMLLLLERRQILANRRGHKNQAGSWEMPLRRIQESQSSWAAALLVGALTRES